MADEIESGQDTSADESPRGRKRRKVDEAAAAAQDVADLTPPSTEVAETPPETPVETPPEQPAETTAAQPEDPFLSRLTTELGFENVTDRSDAEQRLIDAYAEAQRELDEQLAWRRENESLVGYGRQALARQPQQREEPKPAKPWEPPVAFPEQAQRYIVKDEAGVAGWKPDTPQEVRAQAEKFIAWRDQIVDTLATRPDQFFKLITDLIDERSKSVVEPYYEQKSRQQREEEYLLRYEEQNAAKLYRADPRTGQPVYGQFSERGAYLQQRFFVHRQNPNLTVEDAVRYAEFDVEQATRSSAPAQAPTTNLAAQAEQKKRAAVARGNGRTNGATGRNRIGSIPQPGETRTQNDNGGFGEDFVEELMRLTPAT